MRMQSIMRDLKTLADVRRVSDELVSVSLVSPIQRPGIDGQL